MHRLDTVALLHSCFLFSALSRALDHIPNAFALAQACHKTDLHLTLCVCVCLCHAVILQEASDHVPHISDQFIAYTGNTDFAILLNKDTFELDPKVFAIKEDSTSKGTWGIVLLIVRGLLRRPSLSGTPTVTFCSVHIHNVVAKKRDASADLLRRLHGYNVDFIGGDFNMSVFSTVGDVFSDT